MLCLVVFWTRANSGQQQFPDMSKVVQVSWSSCQFFYLCRRKEREFDKEWSRQERAFKVIFIVAGSEHKLLHNLPQTLPRVCTFRCPSTHSRCEGGWNRIGIKNDWVGEKVKITNVILFFGQALVRFSLFATLYSLGNHMYNWLINHHWSYLTKSRGRMQTIFTVPSCCWSLEVLGWWVST